MANGKQEYSVLLFAIAGSVPPQPAPPPKNKDHFDMRFSYNINKIKQNK
jgi:hypothetical protein